MVAACSSPATGMPSGSGSVAASAATAPGTPATGSPTAPLAVSTPVAPESPPGQPSAAGSSPPPARPGQTGPTQRHTFSPTSITLHARDGSTASATVDPVDTGASGELSLPADPGQVGWWQSGALAGDAFGSVVLAGHIDSRTGGIGFFVRLLHVQAGDEVVLEDAVYQQHYRVLDRHDVPKASLATSTDTFSQSVPGRLVLITCTGTWSPATHYPDNLIVTAEPVGTATSRG
jgi:Sortase domain